jgi:hypothetical protein
MRPSDNRRTGRDPRHGGESDDITNDANVVDCHSIINPLVIELLAARRARTSKVDAALKARGLRFQGNPAWGAARVAFQPDGITYALEEQGLQAVILPVGQSGEIIDLVAVDIRARVSRTRLGNATVLGWDHISRAIFLEEPVRLFSDPIEWLVNDRQGAVVLDWQSVRFDFGDVSGLICTTDELAWRLAQAFQEPVRVPKLFVLESYHAAA